MGAETFLAFDIGAESGRAMTGRLHRGRLELTEVARFANEARRHGDSLRWDLPSLWAHVRAAIEAAARDRPLASIGVDTWGCDYALLDAEGDLVEPPYHYRDSRTDHAMPAVFERLPARSIYAVTGVQFLPFNTLFQLDVACRTTPEVVCGASTLLTIPDVLNFWLTGRAAAEYTNATTTQLVDARTRQWAAGLIDELGLPSRLFAPIVEPGTVLGPLQDDVAPSAAGTPVVAPACHDTGSAVAAVQAGGTTAFLSSGTWSLLGTERPAPVITRRGRELNLTNEGGVGGSTRLLKNIAGLWLLQACRRTWASRGLDMSYDELLTGAAARSSSFPSLIDPDDASFLHPDDMVMAIDRYCAHTGQPAPDAPAGYARVILESLALKYRVVLEWLEEVTATRFETIRVIGGGARNRLLNQFTADATGRPVLAGPVEATALGNLAMQMVALGAVASLDEARAVIDRSFPAERFDPVDSARWDREYLRFREYVEMSCA